MYPRLEIIGTCVACDNCRLICPENAIISDGEKYRIDEWSCTMCNYCVELCPAQSIKLVEEEKKTIKD